MSFTLDVLIPQINWSITCDMGTFSQYSVTYRVPVCELSDSVSLIMYHVECWCVWSCCTSRTDGMTSRDRWGEAAARLQSIRRLQIQLGYRQDMVTVARARIGCMADFEVRWSKRNGKLPAHLLGRLKMREWKMRESRLWNANRIQRAVVQHGVNRMFFFLIQSNPMSITEAGQGLYFRLFLKFKIQKHK